MGETRQEARNRFLSEAGFAGTAVVPLADDASFRRYFRVECSPPAVLMDAPPGKEDIRPFIAITHHLRDCGLSAPAIYAADIEGGFLLLEDLGDARISGRLKRLEADEERDLYRLAVDILVHLHRTPPPAALPVATGRDFTVPAYDMAALMTEARLLTDWYMPAVTGRPPPPEAVTAYERIWDAVLADIAGCRDVLVLRDYHVDNLMWLPERKGLARLGLLDYQDGVLGHPAYDLVSLLEDARRAVPGPLAAEMLGHYLARRPDLDDRAFRYAFAALGAQRHAKVIGIFTRLSRRDGKNGYLAFIPHVWRLLEEDLDRLGDARLTAWFTKHLPPSLRVQPAPQGTAAES